jgi:hypothetical protein
MLYIKEDETNGIYDIYSGEEVYNLKGHYRVHKNPTSAPILSQLNSFHALISLRSILRSNTNKKYKHQ